MRSGDVIWTPGRIFRLRLNLIWMCDVRYPRDHLGRRHLLPDDDHGRALVIALIRCGREKAAITSAPWAEKELPALRAEAKRWALDDLGALVGLTYAERRRHHPMFNMLTPGNMDSDLVKKEQQEQHRRDVERDRKYMRAYRQRQKEKDDKMQNTTARDDAILQMLNTRDWMSAPALLLQARRCKAFGRRLNDDAPLRNLRGALHRALRQMVEHGVIEIVQQSGARGPVLWVRKIEVEMGRPDRPISLRFGGPSGVRSEKKAKTEGNTDA